MKQTSDRLIHLFSRSVLAFLAATLLIAVIMLWLQGRTWWCRAGDMVPWSWDIWSTHNSQHVVDPYSFTHVLHGLVEFWLLFLVLGKLPIGVRFVIAVVVETIWEVAENTSYVINKYREETISLNYFGDSIVNSLADIVCCATGFVIGWKLRFWQSAALFFATETILVVWIRDSLLINVVMLIYPLEAIKKWQVGG